MRQHLLIDADDTLWENNIYFEAAIHRFIEFLHHSTLQESEVRAIINEIEHGMGYGSAAFTRSLQETYRRLVERDIRDEDLDYVKSLGESILHHPMQVITDVPETLEYLAQRHALILLTKGQMDEQMLKVENSQLQPFFEHVLVVAEKQPATYIQILADYQLEPAQTWMIGNSPRSDINPARQAGLHTVFLPHPHTWSLEVEELDTRGPGQMLTLQHFRELRNYF